MSNDGVGLIGGTSFVGERVSHLLEKHGYEVTTFSRESSRNIVSLRFTEESPQIIENWIYLAPIWTLPQYFSLLEDYKAKRLVALSSTSRFSKLTSSCMTDRNIASQLVKGEEQVLQWANAIDCTLVILQPTLIYGRGKDKNVSEIARFIRRFGFFPLLGQGRGLRQPVHVDDVASACFSALQVPLGRKCSYVISGQEELSYRTMVERIFLALGRKPVFLPCPLWLFTFAIRTVNVLPPFRGLSAEMAVRMNMDLNFEHTEAKKDLGFRPRPFHPSQTDLVERT
ncbi:MAG: NAD-dependent epimerase/dehydratase family protein [Desulfopila sp.]|nr:NAD-dependent epimerase/dehydratase family protein [Desulfopila sp.]